MAPNGLEKLVEEYHAAGVAWIEARLAADQLEEDLKPYLAQLMNALDDGETSEAKLDRLARGSKEFREYVRGMVTARAEAGRKKVRFEAVGMLWEAKRSQMAFEREKLAKGVFHMGS